MKYRLIVKGTAEEVQKTLASRNIQGQLIRELGGPAQMVEVDAGSQEMVTLLSRWFVEDEGPMFSEGSLLWWNHWNY